MKYKKLGVLTLTAAIAMSTVAPAAYAETVANPSSSVNETAVEVIEKQDTQNLQDEIGSIPKAQLVKRVHELFPNQFTFLDEADFRVELGNHFRYGGFKEEESHGLYFHKETSKGNYAYGSFGFVGSDLQLISFHYTNSDVKDAFYPAKVSKDQAKELAQAFVNKVNKGTKYEVVDSEFDYHYQANKTLTEPIRYGFSIEKIQNEVPVRGLGGNIEVLGNGEIVGFWSSAHSSKLNFEPKNNLIGAEKALEQIKENLNLELRYVSEFDYRKNEGNVYLSYVPIPGIGGVQATSGKWYVDGKFMDSLPAVEKVKMLSETKKDVKTKAITKNEAKKMAEELLKTDREGINLVIQGVNEHTNHLNQTVYSVEYMYEAKNSGRGSSIQFNKNTGEILYFHNVNLNDFYVDSKAPEVKLSYDEALKKAAAYVEKYAPSSMHTYAYPSGETEPEEYYNSYLISFPRVENGIEFVGDEISVFVSAEDGSMQGFNNLSTDYKELPSPEKVVDVEVAKAAFFENLELKLVYANEWSKDKKNDYKLVYEMNHSPKASYFNAVSGKWEAPTFALPVTQEESEKPTIKHAWAEDELNFMLEAKILTIKDKESFNPDAVVTKGQALEILMKSLTRFWEGHSYYRGEEPKATFDNIGVDHPLFEVVDRAVQMGILDSTEKTFDLEAKLTREELAAWYVKALRLHEVAKHSQIYHVEFKDADKIDPKYKGHVAIASAFGILTGANEKFSPTQEVTIAQMAVATFRMANTVNTIKLDNGRDYYYFW
ncbi:PepSY1/2 domain-containing protein [Caldalkalibacillus mannanilyticus]|uniref:PepSY1/2 domain-containing protein n=1 Tax=Caldalkalibacillus mannanilyticus TaxID=1418 RepID=UPI00046ACA47|nr:PepSY1/2 domain-containing protein [Caldalkalibacillus mannanilyticus]